MNNGTAATLELPAEVYAELQALAMAEHRDPVTVIADLVAIARQRQAWLRDLMALREQIRRDGALSGDTAGEPLIERLRQTREEIFETEYAHLY